MNTRISNSSQVTSQDRDDVLPQDGEQPHTWYMRFAKAASHACGQPAALCLALATVGIWLIAGPLFGFSDTWQLVINTTTTIITFLMVFLIQHTQNRDTEAIQIKLDELIRATKGVHNELLDLEELDEAQLDLVRSHYLMLARMARQHLKTASEGSSDPAPSE